MHAGIQYYFFDVTLPRQAGDKFHGCYKTALK